MKTATTRQLDPTLIADLRAFSERVTKVQGSFEAAMARYEALKAEVTDTEAGDRLLVESLDRARRLRREALAAEAADPCPETSKALARADAATRAEEAKVAKSESDLRMLTDRLGAALDEVRSRETGMRQGMERARDEVGDALVARLRPALEEHVAPICAAILAMVKLMPEAGVAPYPLVQFIDGLYREFATRLASVPNEGPPGTFLAPVVADVLDEL